MKSVFGGRHRKTYFPPPLFYIFSIENDNGGPVGNRGFKGGSPRLSKLSKKNVKKISKIGEIGKNFVTESDLKGIGNSAKPL